MRNIGLKNSKINDEIYTPEYAIKPIIKHIKKNWKIWECCYGNGDLAKHLREKGLKVIGNKSEDFFKTNKECDIIITNPPYSNKRDFIERAIKLKRKFAFLVPLTTLEGRSQ